MLVCVVWLQASMQLIKELLLLLLLWSILLLLHYDWRKDRFNLHFVMKRGSKIIHLPLVRGTCEETCLHKVNRSEGRWLKNRHIALFGRDLGTFEMIWCIILMLVLRVTWEWSRVAIIMNSQWLYDSVVLWAKLIAHWNGKLLSSTSRCRCCHIWNVS